MKLYRNIGMLILITMALLVLSIVVIFDNVSENTLTGYNIVNTKVEVLASPSKNCSFQLSPGWNMVSFYCLGLFADRNIVLQSISDSYSSIFEYQANDIVDPWKSYNPSLPNWTVQQLNYMDRVSGYWIYIYNTSDGSNASTGMTNFSYPGIYSDSIIYLYTGWNFIGYPKLNTTNIGTDLNISSYNIVKYYNTTTDTWLIYINGSANNTFDTFETYKGYWLNVSEDQQWYVVR